MRESSPSRRAPGPALEPELLAGIERPSRYLGGEMGQTRKDPASVETIVGLCFPDLYEIAASHLGLRILYAILNDQPDVAAERVCAVATDMEARLRAGCRPLSTLENRIPLRDLDVLGFTLQYELAYSNVLQVLDLGGIPLRSKDRGRRDPLVIAGGPCAFNPEPLAPFVDAVCLGDGEETILRVVRAHEEWRRGGAPREDLLWRLSELPSVYVPSLYEVAYHDDGRVQEVRPIAGAPARVRKATVSDLDSAPFFTATPVPFMKVVHDRVGVEIQRGCARGCRFCQAGFIYRPVRQRSPATVGRLVREGLAQTGWEQVSLLSLSAGDYACMEPLLRALMDEHEGRRAAISLPSMRLETLTPGIADQIMRVRRTSFTVAPEAATDRLRAVINKVIDEDVLVDLAGDLFARGWNGLKLYFMVGLPTEQEDDILAIADLGERCLRRARRYSRGATITVSVSSFVPKPHTPFQWARQASQEEIRSRHALLRAELRKARLGFRWQDARSTVMEGLLSRGDRRVGEALAAAYGLGARMDGWHDRHAEASWREGLERAGIDPAFFNERTRASDEVFPWDHLDCGVSRDWLLADWRDALLAGFVPDCTSAACYDCGVCDHGQVRHRLYAPEDRGGEPRSRLPLVTEGVDLPADPQIDGMPLPPATRQTGVPDLAPPQGRSPGSLAALVRGSAAARPEPPDGRSGRSTRTPRKPVDAIPPRAERVRVEIRYAKRGPLVHLGHLDVMEAFRRALRRIDAPVLWGQGFHPQMRLTFGPPLPAGMASEAEWADLELRRPVDVPALAARLAASMPEGLPILELAEVPADRKAVAARVAGFSYRVEPPACRDGQAVAAAELFQGAASWPVDVDRKGVVQRIDLLAMGVRTEIAPGPLVMLHMPAWEGGPRLRDALASIFGDDAAMASAGWKVRREQTHFRCESAEPQAKPADRRPPKKRASS